MITDESGSQRDSFEENSDQEKGLLAHFLGAIELFAIEEEAERQRNTVLRQKYSQTAAKEAATEAVFAKASILLGKQRLRERVQLEIRRRAERKIRNRLTRAQVDEQVDRLLVAMRQGKGLGKRADETYDEWNYRLFELQDKVIALWNENTESIQGREPRYLEGYPARENVSPPIFLPHFAQKSSELEPCIPCQIKKMKCSRTVVLHNSDTGACRRCVRGDEACVQETNGVYCIMLPPGHRQPNVDEADERASEYVQMLLDQKKGVRMDIMGQRMGVIEPGNWALPMWNLDGKHDNGNDEDRTWQAQLLDGDVRNAWKAIFWQGPEVRGGGGGVDGPIG
ncbi:hypothetical protein S40293_11028 [Stachybotrys chartarum IBT 40293]|nr:hypothetical protein S40293_11028 [Stachybotrys chartarum IBT 40293]KFA75184.1 hypothetical protein S40288_10749 [Stachybotrys chartarum IBT 40288]